MTCRGSAQDEGAAAQTRAAVKRNDNAIFMDSSCAHVECGLAPYREATPGLCLGANRWRGGPAILAKPGRGADGEELHPQIGYRIFWILVRDFCRVFPVNQGRLGEESARCAIARLT